MPGLIGLLNQKLFRAREAFHLIASRAADVASRRTLFYVYASLGKPERYDEEINLRLKIGRQVLPLCMRLSDIFILGEILHEQQYRMQSRLPPNAMIVDAGANIGISALWFAGHYPDARMHVFEPAADNLYYLQKNLAAIPGATLFTQGIGREAGSFSLNLGEFAGMHSLLPAAAGEGGGKIQEIEVVTLADHMERHGIEKIDLLKLDIEGSEHDAILGLGDRIADVEVIVGETHDSLIDVDAFYRTLTDAGFEILWRRNFFESEAQQVHGFEAARRR